MSLTRALSSDRPQTTRSRSASRSRLLYTGVAALLVALTFAGFHLFYLHGEAYPGRPLTPPIRTLVILHGMAMTAWMLLFVVQTALIVTRRHRLHMTLGKIGAGLAVCVVVLGLRLGIEAARVNPPDLLAWGLSPRQFLVVPIVSILAFGIFVLVGIWNRRRPRVHRPMMLLAVLAAMPAALDRIAAIHSLYQDTVWGAQFGPFFSALVIGAFFLVLQRLLTRSWDRVFAIGYAALVAVSLVPMHLATTNAWDHFAGLLLH